jgi:hypothetical protein
MEGECRFVGKHADTFSPEPHDGEILVFTGWEMCQSIDATPNSNDLPVSEVFCEKLRVIPGLSRLGSREMALLCQSDLIETIPIGTRLTWDILTHPA